MSVPEKSKNKISKSIPHDSGSLQGQKKNSSKKHTFICSYDGCDKRYSFSWHLKRHEEIHTGNFQCTEKNCGQYFKTKFTLKKHVDNIHLKKNPKKYKCPQCGEEFNKHNWLTSHQFKHTGEKPYACPNEGCEKRFLYPTRLKRHLKVHEGYTCQKENCGKTFPTWSSLTYHSRLSHSTMFECKLCGKRFSGSNNLKDHMEIHKSNRKVYSCPNPYCTRFYYKKNNLKQHVKSYHEKRPFVCALEICRKAFKTEADMIAHSSRHKPKYVLKKKRKGIPNFATKLSGLAPKKWQLEPHVEHNTEDEETSEGYTSESVKSEDEQELVIAENVPRPEISEDYTLESVKSEDEEELINAENVPRPAASEVHTFASVESEDESQWVNAEKVLSGQSSQNVRSLSDIQNSSAENDYSIDNGIGMLLKNIEKRNEFGVENCFKKTKCISLKA